MSRRMLQCAIVMMGVVGARSASAQGVVPPGKAADSTKAAKAAQSLPKVSIRGHYQKRPSMFNFMNTEPASRTESFGVGTEWLDPLSYGTASALLRADPDLMVGADGSASLMGASSMSNQVELGGVRVPPGLVTGSVGGSVALSQWDVTTGGAAGATVNIDPGPSHRYRESSVMLRSGAGGIPAWTGSRGDASGVDVPTQISAFTTAPIGRFGYRVNGFFSSDVTGLPRWDRALGAQQRGVLDSISGALGVPVTRASERNTQTGILGRLDLDPFNDKHTLALTSALSRSTQSGGTRGGYLTGSLGTDAVEDIGLVALQASNVIHQRLLWTSLASASITSTSTSRAAAAPTIVATDTSVGNTVITGAAPPQARSRIFAAEARSTGTWYSRDNATRYVAQIQVRMERARLNGVDPHATFIAPSLDALENGQAISLVRASGSAPATASSMVFAPALGARHDVGTNGSLMLGVRADAWSTSGISGARTLRYVDVSPRVAYYQRIGRLSGARGPVATLRAGAGRFTSWPNVQQWADAWTGVGTSTESCSGSDVPPITLDIEAPSCLDGRTVQTIGGAIAANDLRPAASNRADVSLAFTQIAPGVRGEIGAAVAHNDRMTARLSPLMQAPVLGYLTGEDGRALLVSTTAITGGGVVPLAAIPAGVSDATRLASVASSSAAQWRIGIATQDPFARVVWNLRYTLTTGRERSLAVASPNTAPAFITGPLSAGGRHAFAFSASEWIGAGSVGLSVLARSGSRFTPLADRDLNGDGLVNDAAYVPTSESAAWAGAVSPAVRSCIRDAAGHVAGIDSCTGPWSVSTRVWASVPGVGFGMPKGSELSLQISNPLALIGHVNGVTFGSVAAVNPMLVHVTGFDPAARRFTGEPLAGFGTPLGLSQGISDPVRLAVSVRVPLGPSVTSQRAAHALSSLHGDTTARGRADAAMEYLGDILPVPQIVLQSGEAIQLTADQRHQLQALGARWQAAATRIVLRAYDGDGRSSSDAAARGRLLQARGEFMIEAAAIVTEVRRVLSPEQIDLLSGMQRMLDPRFWKYFALQDAGEI
jgi:hypothetical protein